MNILIVYNRNIDVDDAGASRTTIELANYLAEKKEVKVFVAFKILNGNKGKVVECPIDTNNRINEYRRLINVNNIDCIIVPESEKLTSVVSEAIDNKNVTIISALHSRPGYERIRNNIPYKITLRSGKSVYRKLRALIHLILSPWYNYKLSNKLFKILRKSYELSDAFVLLSERYKNIFVNTYKIKDNGKKLYAIANGLSFNDIIIDDLIYKKKSKTCLVVGRLDEKSKRLSLLLKMWPSIEKRFPDWRLQIVGTGESEQYYKYLTRKYKIKNVVFEGQQNPLPYYMKAKVFFMTSAYEGFPMTILEALQTGCVPIVMDTFEAIHDVITDCEDGCIIKDESMFVERASLLMNDESLLRKMAFKGIKNCKRFERVNIYEKYYSLIKRIGNN